jgi:hypothetical protein
MGATCPTKRQADIGDQKEIKEEAFPGFTKFCWHTDQIENIPLAWQEVLKHVKGVYVLVCKETGRYYVGSAKGCP